MVKVFVSLRHPKTVHRGGLRQRRNSAEEPHTSTSTSRCSEPVARSFRAAIDVWRSANIWSLGALPSLSMSGCSFSAIMLRVGTPLSSVPRWCLRLRCQTNVLLAYRHASVCGVNLSGPHRSLQLKPPSSSSGKVNQNPCQRPFKNFVIHVTLRDVIRLKRACNVCTDFHLNCRVADGEAVV
jgi:hypothetical protein